MKKHKIRILEERGQFIHYEIYEGKQKVNDGWYKFKIHSTKGEIAKEIANMYNIIL